MWYTSDTMCYSSTASFVAGAALSAAGVVTIKKSRTKNETVFAMIPLLFGAQQIIEGVVWLSFKNSWVFLNQVATYSYLTFAYILWPVIIPVSVGLVESDPERKKIIYTLQLVGALVSVYLLYFILTNPVSSRVINESIAYTAPQHFGVLLVGVYIFVICASCLFSSNKVINIFGVLAALSFSVTYYFYTTSFISVWCFFAAILSGIVYWYFRHNEHA